MSDFKEKKIVSLLDNAKNGDLNSFVQAHLLNNGFFEENIDDSENVRALHICVNGEELFSLSMDELFAYDPDFCKEEMPNAKWMIESENSEDVSQPQNSIVALDKINENIDVKFREQKELLEKIGNDAIDKAEKNAFKMIDKLNTVTSMIEQLSDKQANNNQDEINALKAENARYKARLAELENAPVSSEEVETLKRALESEKEKNQALYELAYSDMKFKVKNNNALNEALKNIVAGAAIAEVSICGIKELNSSRGIEKGDKMIGEVVDAIKGFYNEDEIYRIRGDIFYIIPKSSKDEKQLYSNLLTVRDQLKEEKIRVVFDAKTYKSRQTLKELSDMIEQAKKVKEFQTYTTPTIQEIEEEEDDGFRIEDNINLRRAYLGET